LIKKTIYLTFIKKENLVYQAQRKASM